MKRWGSGVVIGMSAWLLSVMPAVAQNTDTDANVPTNAAGASKAAAKTLYNSPACQISSAWCVGSRAPTPATPNKPQKADYLDNELLLLYSSDQASDAADEVVQRYKLREKRTDELATLKTKMVTVATNGQDPVKLRQTINTQEKKIQANLSSLYYSTAVTARNGMIGDYPLALTGVPLAQQLTKGQGIKIGMVDTPIDILHRSLDNSHVMRVELSPAGDKLNQAHGTEIAGVLISQNPRIGIAPEASLYAVSAFGSETGKPLNRVSTAAMVARAIDQCIKEKVDILNLSFAGAEDKLVTDMLQKALDQGIVVVASAGNGGPDAKPAYPAAMNGVIAVTAVDQKEKLFSSANRGNYIDLAAPGVDILTTSPAGAFNVVSGTSVATAHVSGVIALLMSLNRGGFNPKVLEQTATDLGAPGRDNEYGYGLLNVKSALQAVGAAVPAATP